MLFLRSDDPFNLLEFCSTIPTTASQPGRIQPVLRAIRIPFHVNVRGFGTVRRVKEEPIRALPMNRRHIMSLPRSWAVLNHAGSCPPNGQTSAAAAHCHACRRLQVVLDRAGSEGQDEQCRVWLTLERDDTKPLTFNQGNDLVRARVADVEPDHFGGAPFTKLRSRKFVSLDTIVNSLTFE